MRKSLLLFFFLLFSFSSNSEIIEIDKIKITGNNSISQETILNIAGLKDQKLKLEIDNLNIIQKKILNSNFFSNVLINVTNKVLQISVIENPFVEFVILEGMNNRDDYKKNIEKIINLKPNSVFSDSLLNKDINIIKSFFSSLGYFRSEVNYTIKKIENNRVNIFFNINLNNQFLVKNIFFIGEKFYSKAKLMDHVSTKEDSWLSFFSTSSIPSEDKINYDISSLKNFYLSEGFYDVQITNTSIDIVNDKNVNLTFSISSGKRFKVKNLNLANNAISIKKEEVSYINDKIKILLNNFYNNKKISQITSELQDYFEENNVTLFVSNSINKISDSDLSINFEINEVTKNKIISNIKVLGNDITEEFVIRNNLLFSEGDIYSDLKIQQSKDLLQSLNLFKKVSISKNENTNNSSIDLTIYVEESPTGEISSGIGVGTTGSSLGFSIKEKNFLGKGIKLDTNLNIGTQQVNGYINFTDPDFFNSGNTFGSSVFATKYTYDNAGYENKVIGIEANTQYPIFKDINLQNGFSINYDTISTESKASNIIKLQEGDYLTTKYFYNIFNDKRNRKYKPTAGYTFGFGQGVSFPPSDIPSLNNNIFGSYFKEFNSDFVGSIKYKFKAINSLDGDSVKISDRVFLSDTELRGFAFRGIGPRIDGDFIGGNYSFITNFSTTLPNGLPDSWNASSNIFFDVGNVWGADLPGISDNDKLRSSVGLGFTWSSPMGPISISYAEALSSSSTDRLERFNFRLGGVF